jgi:hypothetical protein
MEVYEFPAKLELPRVLTVLPANQMVRVILLDDFGHKS